jgi:hypothetical protein
MEKVYAHREFGLEANIIGCATYELKDGGFKVAYLAQLSAYLRILNDDDRRDHEEAPIGIILCKHADKDYAVSYHGQGPTGTT